MYFRIFRDDAGWRWEVRAANHRRICESGGKAYPRRKDCELMIDLVKKQSQDAPVKIES